MPKPTQWYFYGNPSYRIRIFATSWQIISETFNFLNLPLVLKKVPEPTVEEWKTNLMSLVILFHFLCAQHVSDINISIIRSLQLCCWITTSVVLFSVRCVLELWCGWFWVVFVLQAEAQAYYISLWWRPWLHRTCRISKMTGKVMTKVVERNLLHCHFVAHKVKWSEVKCREGGGERDFMRKVYISSKVVRSEGLGWKREYNMCGKKYWKLYTVLSSLGVVYLLYMLYFKIFCVYCC